jgi:hypothetical protein
MTLADLIGNGEPDKPCHAAHGDDHSYHGTYDVIDGELVCKSPSVTIYCHPGENSDPPWSRCWDGDNS